MIDKRIDSLKNHKAPGHDGVSNAIIRCLGAFLATALPVIYNLCITLGYFPDDWKRSIIVMVPKKGKDPQDPASYRPISLLPILGKMFEACVCNKLGEWADTGKHLPDMQAGFRKKRSIDDHLLHITNSIIDATSGADDLLLVLFDITKAFDGVHHATLLHKLLSLGLPPWLFDLVPSFLSNRLASVKYLNTISSAFPVEQGVPQGSVLSPLLFSLFTSNIPSPPDGVTLATYADDICL